MELASSRSHSADEISRAQGGESSIHCFFSSTGENAESMEHGVKIYPEEEEAWMLAVQINSGVNLISQR
jgi:hypothetical protein